MIKLLKKHLRRMGYFAGFKIIGPGIVVVDREMLYASPQFKKMLIDIKSIKINPQHQR